MNEKTFKTYRMEAEDMQRLTSSPVLQEFYLGYIRGISKLYHGENFGNNQEHNALMSRSDARGQGYHAGLSGQSPQEGIKRL